MFYIRLLAWGIPTSLKCTQLVEADAVAVTLSLMIDSARGNHGATPSGIITIRLLGWSIMTLVKCEAWRVISHVGTWQ